MVFEVCAGEKIKEEGGHMTEAWWRQETANKQLWETLEEILREE